jgi:hypothetical protein
MGKNDDFIVNLRAVAAKKLILGINLVLNSVKMSNL